MEDNGLDTLAAELTIAQKALEDLAAAFDRLPLEIKAALMAEPERGKGRGNVPEKGRNYWDEHLGKDDG